MNQISVQPGYVISCHYDATATEGIITVEKDTLPLSGDDLTLADLSRVYQINRHEDTLSVGTVITDEVYHVKKIMAIQAFVIPTKDMDVGRLCNLYYSKRGSKH